MANITSSDTVLFSTELRGKQGATCTITFAPYLVYANEHIALLPARCNVTLSGCGEGEKVVEGEEFDTCVEQSSSKGDFGVVGWVSVVVLLLLVVAMGTVIVVGGGIYGRKKYRAYVLAHLFPHAVA